MIPAPIVYSKESLDILDACKGTPLAPQDWSDAKFTDIKTEIKEYYKVIQNYTCPYCQQKIQIDHNMAWDIEHIIPRIMKPKFMFEPQNLCIACKDCNGPKSGKNVLKNSNRKTFPNKPKDYIIVHPHFHSYNDHIEILVPGLVYRPISDEGKNTAIACDLYRFYKFTNRKPVNNLSSTLAKKVAFADTVEEQEQAEIQFFELLKLKHAQK
ncbi:HNH endonuclease [Geomonas paludis]|uniref:HNH nuclease domain-containing protein n=1 Tax=Geomonas paludis TaxID=2740185 RepID=A0A6V8MY37_9BACT|nr:HNH endonuclease [Geomonas paludis]GFO65042.1 hypothetical protein GMPD_29610 [Geomonas paludis]